MTEQTANREYFASGALGGSLPKWVSCVDVRDFIQKTIPLLKGTEFCRLYRSHKKLWIL